jgi:hypothetical protein
MPINNGVTNQKGTPAFYTDTFANRPAFGYAGRVFISTDSGQIFEDTGTAWTLIADAGVGGGTLSSVCLNGNTTASGIVITAGGLTANNIQSKGLISILNGTTSTALSLKTGSTGVQIETDSISLVSSASSSKTLSMYFDIAGVSTKADFNANSLSASRTYTLPNATGTIALTSDISNFVPYTGATTNVILGGNTLSCSQVKINGDDASVYGFLGFKQFSGGTPGQNGYTSLYATGVGNLNIFFSATGGNKTISFQSDLISANTTRTFSLPDANGTIALTSNLSSYVPYTGATANLDLGTFDFTTDIATLNQVKAVGSGGISFNANSGTQIALMGAGGGANMTLYGGLTGTSATFSSSVSTTGGTLPSSNGMHSYFTSNVSYIDSLQSGVAWRDISIGGNDVIFRTGGIERARISSTGQFFIGGTLGLGGKVVVFNDATTGINIMDSSNNGQLMIFNNSGAVQIGSITTNGSITAYNVTSDYRLKQDLKDYNGLNLLSKIKTYDYEWKSNKSRMYGVIAHELAEILPYAVHGEKDAKDMQQVDYSKIVPILIKAIQELNAKFN